MDEAAQQRNYCDFLWALLASNIIEVTIAIDVCFPTVHQDWIRLDTHSAIINSFMFFSFSHSQYKLRFRGKNAWQNWDKFIRSGMCVYSLKGRAGVTSDQITASLVEWETLLRAVCFVTSI